jgi:uncharacterized delta-60 repeat protein
VKAWRFVSTLVLVCGCLGVTASFAVAAPADLDHTFGQRGFAGISPALDVPQFTERVVDMAIGPQDEIFVLSEACPKQPECLFAVTRYSHDGFRDFAYGSGGRAVISVQLPSGEYATPRGSIAVDGSGNVLLATSSEGNLALFRLDVHGAPDPSFGQAGRVITDLGGVEAATKVELQADGKIVVAGSVRHGLAGSTSSDLLLARYLPDGSPDPGFGQQGSVVSNLLPNDQPVALAIDANGRIVVGVDECCSGRGRAVVARYLPEGALDGSFSSQVGAGAATSLSEIVPLSNGKLYVMGNQAARGGRGGSGFIARLLENGRPDRAFGRGGITSLGSSAGSLNRAAIDSSGRLVLAGTSDSSARGSFLWVMRRLPNGRPDRTFAGGWQQRVGFGGISRASGGVSEVGALALQSDGRIVVLGEGTECVRSCSSWQPVLLRFFGGNSGVRCMGRKATIVGTRSGEVLKGTGHRDVIAGLAGNDRIKGRGGNDLICGGPGHDRIDGGPGRNRVRQ